MTSANRKPPHPDMVWIPGDTFKMGSEEHYAEEAPVHQVTVDSFWMDSAGMWSDPVRPPLRGRQLADIAIVGGGFAGMSTAYHLARRFPEKRIVLLEGARCGYGASGRNGGFAHPGMPGLGWVYETLGPEAARAYYDGTVEIAYGIVPTFQERGYATEAAEACIAFAFADDRVRLVRGHTLAASSASTRVLEKCGFLRTGEVEDPEDGPVWRWERPGEL